MLVLRYAGLVALTLWVGGLVALGGLAAPAIFEVLAASHVAGDRQLAGAIFGETLRRFHLLGYICAGVLFATLLARGILGPRPSRFAVRLGMAFAMGLAMLASGRMVSPRIAQLQSAIGAAPSTLPEGDGRRVRFGRLHAASSGLLLVPVLGGLFLLYRETRD